MCCPESVISAATLLWLSVLSNGAAISRKKDSRLVSSQNDCWRFSKGDFQHSKRCRVFMKIILLSVRAGMPTLSPSTASRPEHVWKCGRVRCLQGKFEPLVTSNVGGKWVVGVHWQSKQDRPDVKLGLCEMGDFWMIWGGITGDDAAVRWRLHTCL